MIDPPQVLSEEPTAVTPHGGICGGESQQWLSYPTKPHAGICAGGREKSADSGDLERSIRSFVNTESGDHEHLLAWA